MSCQPLTNNVQRQERGGGSSDPCSNGRLDSWPITFPPGVEKGKKEKKKGKRKVGPLFLSQDIDIAKEKEKKKAQTMSYFSDLIT